MKSSPLLLKPEFVSQFNAVYHPEYEAAVSKRACEYFRSRWPWTSEKQKEAYTQNDGELVALLCCFRAPEDRAEVGAEYIVFYYAFDDFLEMVEHDKAIKAVEGIKRVLDDHPPQNAIENILHDLRSRMLSFGDNRTRELANTVFIRTVKYLEVAINRAERRKVFEQGLGSYLKYRHTDSGFWFCIAVYAWELDLGPPPQYIREDPDFDMLLSLAIDQLVLINDMYSYRWEAFGLGVGTRKLDVASESENAGRQDEQGYFIFNAVGILLREEGVDDSNVMDRLGAYIHKKESDFTHTAKNLRMRYKDRTDDLAVIEMWVAIMTEWMAGNYYWSSICRRYNKMDDILDRQ